MSEAVETPEVKVDDLGFDPSLKKKKKSKSKTLATDEVESTPEVDDMFSGLKKKKKKAVIDTDATEEGDLTDALGDLTLKKKKKKSATIAAADEFEQQLEEAGITDETTQVGGTGSTPPVYEGIQYEDLLSRFFQILKENNPELAGDRSGPKFRIPPPVCQREGNKKTLFANVQEICQVLQRSPEHVIQYLFAELGTSGSIDGQKRLVIKGRFQPKQIENVLRRYIMEYVTCKTCKSMNTEMKRESANRLHFLRCKACGSTRSVSSIKTGFQAHVGKRKKTA